ncbi:helix-turn-helix domain-containing protein [Paenibacillus sp. YN15]|uniref:helix-turn-helix domain-containing protein n=1 Tax=Paenibacillus sp. YN15 TaxID=1742774 RepID=UPI0011BF63C7|nr:helix-turn-helix domain-containing protein [Paenibacillus sp. YN15]
MFFTKKTWYHRMLLSYLPIYFLVTSVIILLAFLMISNMAKREAVDANRIYTEQQMQALDKSLREIDDMLVKDLQYDAVITRFYKGGQPSSYLDGYETSKKLSQLTATSSLIDSIYLYRFEDSMIMSPNMMIPVDKFGDRAFADSFRTSSKLYTFSQQRDYKEFLDQDYPSPVFSIVRNYPLLGKHQGIIVVNISVVRLKSWLADSSRSERSFLYIENADGEPIHATDTANRGTELSRIKSPYTGWEFVSGVRDGHLFRYASLFSYVWIICGLLVTGLLGMLLITRRNYKPIELIIDRIRHHDPVRLKPAEHKDELKLIDQALESLIERTQTYQKLHEEDVGIRRRQLLLDLTDGVALLSPEEWKREAQTYGLPEEYGALSLALFEIDQFAAWNHKYNTRDQHLFKYVLASVIGEVAEVNQAGVWTEWMSGYRLLVVYFCGNSRADEQFVLSLAEQVRAWVEAHLDFTVTAGISSPFHELAELSRYYDQAAQALSYKHTVGMNRILQPVTHAFREPYRHVQNIRQLVLAYRTFDSQWEELYRSVFAEIRRDLINREELNNLLQYLVYNLNKEMTGLSPKVVELWTSRTFPELLEASLGFDLIDEPEERMQEILASFQETVLLSREHRGNLPLAKKIRKFVDDSLGNPDLSLTMLCDQFGLHGKYISRIFREEFGEKLAEYIVRARMEKSKEMLAGTGLSIQEIALAVGYVHDVSFIRAFKKTTGQPPGEYRKGLDPGSSASSDT